MLGWEIFIAQQTPEECDSAGEEAGKTALLASWIVGLDGTDWLDRLVDEGKAIRLSRNGYPSRYVAKAGDVLPLIENGPPDHIGPAVVGDDYFLPADWRGKVWIDRKKLAACPSDKTLTIDAWDQS